MAAIWLTYAWDDNKNKDVDFVAQELEREALHVKLDRWNLGAGRRLWEQIEGFITDPAQSDAWLLYATQNSLGSEPCKEEFAYALDRALHTRGPAFPVIGLFPASVDSSLIPAGIKTRLYVSLADADWKERIKAAAEGRAPTVDRPDIPAYAIGVYDSGPYHGKPFAIEMRPRAGIWYPFVVGIPIEEKESADPNLIVGPSGRVPGSSMLGTQSGASSDGRWWCIVGEAQATPTMSFYLLCNRVPSSLRFGTYERGPLFTLTLASTP